MVHLDIFDIDGSHLWSGDYKEIPKVGLTFKRNGRILRVVEVVGTKVVVMEREL